MSKRTFITILAGEKFGRWTAIHPVAGCKRKKWVCRCDCGTKERAVQPSCLISGSSQSCGCLHREIVSSMAKTMRLKHGASRGHGTRAYMAWGTMLKRCTNKNSKKYKDYGGRGITVCQRWTGDAGFANFLSDMGEPEPGMSIDRKDNNAGYSPENCRWATAKEQARNRRVSLLVSMNGKTQLLIEWCEQLGMRYKTVHSRIRNLGWDAVKALTTPIATK